MKVECLKRSSNFYSYSLNDCPLTSKIIDEYSERCYQVLKMPSNDLETFRQQKRKTDETKGRAVVLASWLRALEESTKIERIEERLVEGNVSRVEAPRRARWGKRSKHRATEGQWRVEGMMDKNGEKWLTYLSVCPQRIFEKPRSALNCSIWSPL